VIPPTAELDALAAWRSPTALALEADVVHLWRIATDSSQPIAELFEGLAIDERRRADRYRSGRDRRTFVVSRATLRSLLGRYLGLDPREVPIGIGDHCKPEVGEASTATGLTFNIAHSGDVTLFAFARDRRVRIDVEVVRPVPELDLLVPRLFTTNERHVLGALRGRARLNAFFHGWTRKEALAKGVGAGLTLAFDRLEVPLGEGAAPTALHLGAIGHAGRWWLHPLRVGAGYVAAVAVEGDGHRVAWRE
jgi:4'-phosphopantetheinyl transferase